MREEILSMRKSTLGLLRKSHPSLEKLISEKGYLVTTVSLNKPEEYETPKGIRTRYIKDDYIIMDFTCKQEDVEDLENYTLDIFYKFDEEVNDA